MLNDIAILYDFLYCPGGAEKTSLTLLEGIPNATLYVDFVNKKNFEHHTLPEQIVELGSTNTFVMLKTLQGLYNFSRKTAFLKNYQTVIYSGSNAPVAVHNQSHGLKVLYCHTIPRFAYDLHDYYLQNLPKSQRPAFILFSKVIRRIYEKSFAKMDIIIANSQNVRERIQHYLKSDAVVIPPPVETASFSWKSQKDYYLSTARVEDYKRIDTIVEAFKKMPDKKLIVASGGSQLEKIQQTAKSSPNISFTGWTTEEELQKLVGNCIATLYLPKNEDFGISPVESMAAGKPVIGANEGGITETVLHNKTGLLIEPTIPSIIQAVYELPSQRALLMKEECTKRASLFSKNQFIDKIKGTINIT